MCFAHRDKGTPPWESFLKCQGSRNCRHSDCNVLRGVPKARICLLKAWQLFLSDCFCFLHCDTSGDKKQVQSLKKSTEISKHYGEQETEKRTDALYRIWVTQGIIYLALKLRFSLYYTLVLYFCQELRQR